LVIIIIFVVFRLGVNFKIHVTNHGEDTYQIEKSTRDNQIQRVFTYTIYNFKKSIEWQQYLINTVHKLEKLYKTITNNYGFEYINSSKKLSLKPSEKVIFTTINMKKKSISTSFDHSYCSGHFFLKYGTVISNGTCPNLPTFPRLFGIAEYYLIKFAIERNDIPLNKVFNIVKNKEEMKRLYFTLDTKKVTPKCHTRTWILYEVLSKVIKCIHPIKSINVMIPVPFKQEKKISNNIGVLFIKFDDKTNILTLQNQIDSCKTQAIATNYYLKLNMNKKIGKDVRNNVDMIFSSGYIKNNKVTPMKSITTYNGVPDYGLYCLTGTMGNTVHITLTISTNDINFNTLKDMYPNSEVVLFDNV
tara:strand:+ start:574 stop:1650 length:1077 start_codon:yes stop_codon:yes gene_type:complete